jgi:hypothetical protein
MIRWNSLRSSAFTLAACLLLILLASACAPHQPVRNDLAAGIIGHAVWPCKMNLQLGIVKCPCSEFEMSIDAKSGTTVLRCTENGAK